MVGYALLELMRFYFTCRFGKIHVVIRGWENHRRKSATICCFVLFLRHQPFSSSKPTPAVGCWHRLLAAGETWLSTTARDWPQQTKRKPAGDKLVAHSELLCNFYKFWSTSARLRVGSPSMQKKLIDASWYQGLRCVRCYARRLGASRRNAHAEAQAALGPGPRQTSHAIVRPLRPPFLSFHNPLPSLKQNWAPRW